MPTRLLRRRDTATTTTTTTTNSDSGDHLNHHHLHLIPANKYSPLPPALIRELSLHAPSLLANPAPDTLHKHHSHRVGPGQASSAVIHTIAAPADIVWSVVRRFEDPLPYKRFLKSCRVVFGDVERVGALREVRVVSGLPASSSTERLDVFDDARHVIGFSVVGGEHRLRNYRSVTTLHEHPGRPGATLVVESYVVDVPPENTAEETCVFADTIVRCNLHALAQVVQNMIAH